MAMKKFQNILQAPTSMKTRQKHFIEKWSTVTKSKYRKNILKTSKWKILCNIVNTNGNIVERSKNISKQTLKSCLK